MAIEPHSSSSFPRGFWTLFLTEMWERYSYFANRTLLVLFLVSAGGGFALDDRTATAIYGLFTASTYLAGLPGGWVGDRLLGSQRAVLWGGVGILIGNLLLALHTSPPMFYLGLAVIVCGVGLLKPNVSALVAAVYRDRPGQLDSAFTLYYMGICIGAALAAIVAPLAAVAWGWRFGYAAAACGMALGLLVFWFTRNWLGDAGRTVADAAPAALRWRVLAVALLAGLIGALGIRHFEVGAVAAARAGTALIVCTAAGYFAWLFGARKVAGDERRRMLVIIALCLACALFWSGADLAGSALNLFAERFTDRSVAFAGLSWEIPAGTYQSINPVLIVVLGPFLSALWLALARRGRNPAAGAKFAVAIALVALGLVVMALASGQISQGHKVGPSWLISTYVLHTIGELCLSPLGLAAINQLTPRRLAGQMMGMWFLSVALGTIVASQIAGTMSPTDFGGMRRTYWLVALVLAAAGALLWALNPLLRRLSSQDTRRS